MRKRRNTHYKAEYKLRETAQRFANMYSLDEVYGLQLYPQKWPNL